MEPIEERFLAAVEQAIQEQVVPMIFTAEERAEMNRPWHERSDYYAVASLTISDESFAECYGVKPQLGVFDPRISEHRLKAAPKAIDVSFEGKAYHIPLRVFQYDSLKNVSAWKNDLDFKHAGRKIRAELEPALKVAFNLNSGTDYYIGNGISAVNSQKAVSLLVQLFSREALSRQDEIKALVDQELESLVTDRPFKVTMSGPIYAI